MNHDHPFHVHEPNDMIKLFQGIPNVVNVYLFSKQGINDPFTDVARKVIQTVGRLTQKVVFHEYDLDSEEAENWNVEASPTLLFSPEKYDIKWLGSPVGEEAKMFVEAIILLGYGTSAMSEQASKVIDRIEDPREVKVFVSPTCPYCPQQAMNALKAAIQNPESISLEIIDIQANPKIAESYGAHSVPLTFSDDIMIAQGAQSEELFAASLDKMEQQTIFIPDSDAEEVEADLVIIGGGPAGLSAGIYAARSGLNTIVVEKNVLGGQVTTTPVVENYPGITQIGGKTLVDIMVSHALEYVNIFVGEEILSINKEGERFSIKTTRRKILSKTILITTGAKHKNLGAVGEQRFSGLGVSYCSTCDGPLFKNKKVLMVGGGNSAVTEALHLKNIGVDVTVVHRSEQFRAQDVLVKKLVDSGIKVFFNTEVKEIRGEGKVSEVLLYNNKTKSEAPFKTDGVFIAIGYEPSVELAKAMGVELNEDGFIKAENFRTNIPGVYAAGDVVGGFKQIVTAAGQGSGAALTIFEDTINPYWKDKKGRNLPA